MANETVLLLQDAESPNVRVLTLLIRGGYVLHPAATVDEALYRLASVPFELIIVNLDSENADCPWCAELRAASNAPILLLGPTEMPEKVVSALANGADVYLPTTSAISIIEAHISAMLRRFSADAQTLRANTPGGRQLYYSDERLFIDIEQRRVLLDEEPVDLTPTEFNLLACLLANTGRPVPYEEILTRVWGWEKGDHSQIHTHISHLRKKLGESRSTPRYIRGEYGVGYCFQCH